MMKLVVLCCVVAAAATARAPVYFAPAAIPFVLPVGYPAQLQQPLFNYRGPLSLAPGQPANILAADGRPLDTLDVNLDRTAHFVAKAFDNSHVLKKRSVTRLNVEPGTPGYYAAVAADNIAPVALSPSGGTTAIATNPVGVSTTGLAGPLGSFTASLRTPVAADFLTASAALPAGPIAVSTAAVGGRFGVVIPGNAFVRNF